MNKNYRNKHLIDFLIYLYLNFEFIIFFTIKFEIDFKIETLKCLLLNHLIQSIVCKSKFHAF
jgi:hypothetical protein